MTTLNTNLPAPTTQPFNLLSDRAALINLNRWWSGALFGVVLGILYAPVVAEGSRLWFTDDNYAHGVFIFPISTWLIWMQREQIRKLPVRPSARGLLPLGFGLLLLVAASIIGSKALAMLSLIPVLAGAVLILHGPYLWKLTCFPICFLAFAARMPGGLTDAVSQWAQRASTTGAAVTMALLGYPLMRHGNLIELPGITLEVADVCSGLKKLIAMVALALLYGYLFNAPAAKRFLLVLIAIVCAVLANILRISGLVAVASSGGPSTLHAAHDPAELLVLVLAFFLFVSCGKWIGCKKIRFSH